jgi:membrane-associated phospholipid phosphatase
MTLRKSLAIYAAATVIATAIAVTWLDHPLALYLRGFAETGWFRFFVRITDLANGAIWYTLAAVMLAITWLRARLTPNTMSPAKFTQHVRAWAFMIVAMATSGVVLNLIKVIVGRERPKSLFDDGAASYMPFTFDVDAASFPSGHTQSICAAMLALAFIYPRAWPLYLVTAALISASRVIIGAHYLGDVIGGAFVGIAAVILWRAWFEKNGVRVKLSP